jgi:hypothetical protein
MFKSRGKNYLSSPSTGIALARLGSAYGASSDHTRSIPAQAMGHVGVVFFSFYLFWEVNPCLALQVLPRPFRFSVDHSPN